MSEREALFRAILAAPDDDAPRLIFADWLEEHNEPERAEFIRTQCALARLPEKTSCWKPLQERAARLEREFRTAWAGPTLAHVLNVTFRRGFIDHVQVTVEYFLSAAQRILEIEPVRVWQFRPVSIFLRGLSFDELAACPMLSKVRGLHGDYYVADEMFSELTHSPYLQGLQTIVVTARSPASDVFQRFFEAATNVVLENHDDHQDDG